MLFGWDASLAPQAISFGRRGMSISGPASLSGRTQVAQYDAGYWVATLSRMNAVDPAHIKAYRRLFALQEGGAHAVMVPVFDRVNAPWPVPGTYSSTTRFSDGTTFSDGTEFLDFGIIVALSGAHSARSTQITVTATTIGTLVGGEYFSIGKYLYQLTEPISATVWKIWPPLRADHAAGAEINFDWPQCPMRLMNEGDDDLKLEYGRYGFPDLNFIEVFE